MSSSTIYDDADAEVTEYLKKKIINQELEDINIYLCEKL